jgi:hypothetical protein
VRHGRDRACAEEALTISREYGFAFRAALDSIPLGWATAALGDEGVRLMVRRLASYRSTGAEAWRHYWLSLLAETYAGLSRHDEGLNVAAEGLATVQANGECYCEPSCIASGASYSWRCLADLWRRAAIYADKVLKGAAPGTGAAEPPRPPGRRAGAHDESEMGVLHDLYQPQRAANLRARLDEYKPAGMDAGIIYVT